VTYLFCLHLRKLKWIWYNTLVADHRLRYLTFCILIRSQSDLYLTFCILIRSQSDLLLWDWRLRLWSQQKIKWPTSCQPVASCTASSRKNGWPRLTVCIIYTTLGKSGISECSRALLERAMFLCLRERDLRRRDWLLTLVVCVQYDRIFLVFNPICMS